MVAKILDGEALAKEFLNELSPIIKNLREKEMPPRLVSIRANDNKGSESYAKMQEKHCGECGVDFLLENLPADSTEEQILNCIESHNHNPLTSAIMLHMPLPKGVDSSKLTAAISPLKDAEGMHPANLGNLLFDADPIPGPCTALSAVKLALKAANDDVKGKNVVVVGRSQIVGRPAALMMMEKHATVTVAHSRTQNMTEVTKSADILIVATGAVTFRWSAYRKALAAWHKGEGDKPEKCDLSYLITSDMVKKGAIVIDVGVNRIPVSIDEDGEPARNKETGKIKLTTVGDVDYEAVKEVAGIITSPKGGVGPVTNAMLIRNTVFAAKKIAGI
jgi:methylenetetrahydrofolate dehydrogenase (NADP+)/methenyltetrahydrofolate cyclohydrolase